MADESTDTQAALLRLRDRSDIHDILSRYSVGIDNREWDAWNGLFTSDAELDYSSIGIGVVSPDEFRTKVTRNDPVRISGQHLHTNELIQVDDDEATARVEYTMANLIRTSDAAVGQMTHAGGWCVYRLRRTTEGWKIRHRDTFPKWSEHTTVSL